MTKKTKLYCDLGSPSINFSKVYFSIEVINDEDEIIGCINHDLANMKVTSNISSEEIKIREFDMV